MLIVTISTGIEAASGDSQIIRYGGVVEASRSVSFLRLKFLADLTIVVNCRINEILAVHRVAVFL